MDLVAAAVVLLHTQMTVCMLPRSPVRSIIDIDIVLTFPPSTTSTITGGARIAAISELLCHATLPSHSMSLACMSRTMRLGLVGCCVQRSATTEPQAAGSSKRRRVLSCVVFCMASHLHVIYATADATEECICRLVMSTCMDAEHTCVMHMSHTAMALASTYSHFSQDTLHTRSEQGTLSKSLVGTQVMDSEKVQVGIGHDDESTGTVARVAQSEVLAQPLNTGWPPSLHAE